MTEPEEDYGLLEGEVTGRVRRAVHSEISTVKKIQFWATLGLTVAGLGFGAAFFFQRYAKAEDLAKIADKQDALVHQLDAHTATETAKQAVLEAQGRRTEEDFHFLRDQLGEVARRTGARILVVPRHPTLEGGTP